MNQVVWTCVQDVDRSTENVLFGLLCGLLCGPGYVGKPRELWSNVVVSDIPHLSSSKLHQAGQQKSMWRA